MPLALAGGNEDEGIIETGGKINATFDLQFGLFITMQREQDCDNYKYGTLFTIAAGGRKGNGEAIGKAMVRFVAQAQSSKPIVDNNFSSPATAHTTRDRSERVTSPQTGE